MMQKLSLKKIGKWFSLIILFVCALMIIAEFVFHRYGETKTEDILLFPAFFGFLAFIFIVFAGVLLRKLVMRKEDYYDK